MPVFFKFRFNDGVVFREIMNSIYQLAVHNNSGRYPGLGASNVNGFVNTVNGNKAKYPDIQLSHIHSKKGTPDLAGFLASLSMMELLLKWMF